MKKKRLLLALSLVGFLTGCGAPQENTEGNNNQTEVTNGKDGVGIKSITLTTSEGNVDTYTITYTDNTTTTFKVTNGVNGEQGIQGEPGADGHTPVITIGENGNWFIDGIDSGVSAKGTQGEQGPEGPQGPQGDQGEPGKDGNGIKEIKLTKTEGNVDTYTIYFTDGTETTFTVTNGADGEAGIDGEPGEDGHTPEITIGENGNWFIDGVDTGFSAKGTQGEQGEQGPQGDKGEAGEDGQDGNGIKEIKLTKTEGNVDTYTIYFTDGKTTTFDITNGTSGEDGKSAFEIFKEYNPNYEGNEKDWINDIINGEFNKVKVTFDANGGTIDGESTVEIKQGHSLGNNLPIPTKPGKTFLGWYTGRSVSDVEVNKLTAINSDITLVAKWDTYDVRFLNKDGTLFKKIEVKHGNKATKPDSNPVTSDNAYLFLEWSFDFEKPIFSDTVIKSSWSTNGEVLIQMGSYPQSVVNDVSIKEKLSNLENGTVAGTVLEYDSDGDGIIEKYLCEESVWTVKADDGSKIEKGINYFRFDPIEWLILAEDSTSYSVISRRVLDAKHWNETPYIFEDETTYVEYTVYNNYEKSDIRKWLNNDFYNIAFTEEEKSRIPMTFVDNSASSTLYEPNTYACNNTEDKVYLLSNKEMTQNPFSASIENIDKARIGNATDYAKAIGVGQMMFSADKYGDCAYWTRSPGLNFSNNVCMINNYGYYTGQVFSANKDFVGVRPGLHINL